MALENYETVAERLARWLEQDFNGTPRVITHMKTEPGADICVFRAELYIGDELLATGWAEEIRGQGNVNRTSHVENCETSAIGRALANCGIAGSDPARRASREEMAKVQRYQTANPGHENTVVRTTTVEGFDPGRPLTGGISEKQIGYIRGACKRDGSPSPVGLEGWSKQDASSWIDAHKTGTAPAQCPTPFIGDEEPF